MWTRLGPQPKSTNRTEPERTLFNLMIHCTNNVHRTGWVSSVHTHTHANTHTYRDAHMRRTIVMRCANRWQSTLFTRYDFQMRWSRSNEGWAAQWWRSWHQVQPDLSVARLSFNSVGKTRGRSDDASPHRKGYSKTPPKKWFIFVSIGIHCTTTTAFMTVMTIHLTTDNRAHWNHSFEWNWV